MAALGLCIVASGCEHTQAPVAQAAESQMPAAQSEGVAEMVGVLLYAEHCAACHGEALNGFDHAPALRGAGFIANWEGQPQRRLYSRIISTMPLANPGSLDPADALAITLFVLEENAVPIMPARDANDLNNRDIILVQDES